MFTNLWWPQCEPLSELEHNSNRVDLPSVVFQKEEFEFYDYSILEILLFLFLIFNKRHISNLDEMSASDLWLPARIHMYAQCGPSKHMCGNKCMYVYRGQQQQQPDTHSVMSNGIADDHPARMRRQQQPPAASSFGSLSDRQLPRLKNCCCPFVNARKTIKKARNISSTRLLFDLLWNMCMLACMYVCVNEFFWQ